MGVNATDTAALDALPLLRHLPAAARDLVANSFERVDFEFGDVIATEGEVANSLVLVTEGNVRAVRMGPDGQEVAVELLGPGSSFGGLASLDATPLDCTMRASGAVAALRLHATVLRALVATTPEIRRSMELHDRHTALRHFFRIYSSFAHLPDDVLVALLDTVESVAAPAGTLIFQEDDTTGGLFVVEDGHLRSQRAGQDVAFLRRGDFFGEDSMLTGRPRSTTVVAVSDCRLLGISADRFHALLSDYPAFKAQVAEHAERHNFKHVATVPLDFADEILPAAAQPFSPVGRDQVDHHQEDDAEPETAPGFAGPFATSDGRFVKSRKRLRQFPRVWQIDEADCGAACLAAVCRHFGRAVSLPTVRQAVGTGIDGTSLKGLTTGGQQLGLAARAVKASKRNLDAIPLPAIVHWDANHWIVLYDVRGDHVRVMDPAVGPRRYTRHEFLEKWSGYAALLERTPALDDTPIQRIGVGWLATFFRSSRRALLFAALLALSVSALQMLLPVFIQIIVDRVLPQRDFELLRVILLSISAVTVVMFAASLAQRYILSRTTVRVDTTTFDFLAGRMLALPMAYFYARRTGDIQRRLAGMQQVRQLVVDNGVVALTAVTQLVAALVLMIVYSRLLGAIFLAALPAYVLLMRAVSQRLRPIFESLEEAFGNYYSRQIDAIKGIEAVKALGAEQALRRQLLEEFTALAHRLFRADFTAMCFEGGVQLVNFASLALFLWIGSLQVLHGNMTIGDLVAFNALVVLANGPIGALLNLWDELQLASVLLTRVGDVVTAEPEQGEDRTGLVAVPSLEGHVGFHNVGFRYGDATSPSILEEITFDVPAGTAVAIVGRSGSGKTTLVKCLAGLVEPTEGTITYDGVDVTALDYRDLRRHIGFVLQENFLFADTIAKNIAFGEAEVDRERVEWAAKLANAHEFIARLPLGYDTKVGETGILVSGGQRQRIAIARAVYHRPPILIFDEATSALDTESERAVQDNLERVLSGRTSFIIAHRLSTIRSADVILVLEKGRLVEHGTHDELMARKGLYFYLCSQQLTT
jgi:ATP-binding cassette subfamily B protein